MAAHGALSGSSSRPAFAQLVVNVLISAGACCRCDLMIHTANAHTAKHHRLLLIGMDVGLNALPLPGEAGRTEDGTSRRLRRSTQAHASNLPASTSSTPAAGMMTLAYPLTLACSTLVYLHCCTAACWWLHVLCTPTVSCMCSRLCPKGSACLFILLAADLRE